jgi:two-component system, NarL family, nitrate/nitrite response regulator NarL
MKSDNGRLTVREIEVCQKIMESKNNETIAKELFISVKTVKTHIHNILNKLGLKSRYQIELKEKMDKK